jgi:DNA-binding winged helix-turn-helix (wHTH) protein
MPLPSDARLVDGFLMVSLSVVRLSIKQESQDERFFRTVQRRGQKFTIPEVRRRICKVRGKYAKYAQNADRASLKERTQWKSKTFPFRFLGGRSVLAGVQNRLSH